MTNDGFVFGYIAAKSMNWLIGVVYAYVFGGMYFKKISKV